MKKPFSYITEAVKFYFQKENFLFFAKVMSILVIISTALSLVSGYFYPVNVYENLDFSNYLYGSGFIVLSLVMVVFGIFTKSATLFSVVKSERNIKEVYKMGWKMLWKYFAATFFLGIVISLGFVLLIIPGVIFAVWYSFTIFIVFDKNQSVFLSLRESKKLVKGRFWKIFGRFIVIGLVSFVVGLIFSSVPYAGPVLTNFAAPLFLLPSYLLYKDVSSTVVNS